MGRMCKILVTNERHGSVGWKFPINLHMFSFLSIRVRSLAPGMKHRVGCSDWWGTIAEQVLREEGLLYKMLGYCNGMIWHSPEGNTQKIRVLGKAAIQDEQRFHVWCSIV